MWSSKALTVDVLNSGASIPDVEHAVADLLHSRGFVDTGKGGRDEMQGTRTSFNFQGPDDIIVSISVDRPNFVPIRVSQNRSAFLPEAEQLYRELVSSLDKRWPGSVCLERKGEKFSGCLLPTNSEGIHKR